nr:hypothetical protein [Tanacetum cinerariifolium]
MTDYSLWKVILNGDSPSPIRVIEGVVHPNTDGDADFEVKEPKFDGRKPESEVHVSPSSKFEDFSNNSINEVNAAGTPVFAVGKISTNSTNTFSAAGPSNTNVSPTHGKSSCVDASQYTDDPNMPELEDITYSDDDEEDVATQTRSMTRVAKDQGGLSQINNDDFHTCMFACFLSQEEPKRVHQALKDPSWIEAMLEELLQFKMQKVWVLVDLPNGKRAIDGKSASSPIDTEKPLLKDPDGKDVDVHTYKSMIGSLIQEDLRNLKGKPHLGLWYPKDLPFNLVAYSDSDYVGASLDRKSTTGGCQFLGYRLISWQCKKQTVFVTSSTEAEYVATASCCAQVLWMKNQLLDYGLNVTAVSSSFCYLVNDVMCLQALVDKKKVIITKATIREALRLDDAESIDCLPNEEIFIELSRMGVGKGFSRVDTPLFEGMIVAQQDEDVADEGAASVAVNDVPAAADEPSIPSPTPTTQPPPPSQDLPSTSQVQPTTPPSPIAQPPSPQQQPQPSQSSHDAEVSMDLLHTLLETCTTLTRRVKHLEQDKIAQTLEITKGGIIANIDTDEDVTLKSVAAVARDVDAVKENAYDDEIEPVELKEVVEVVTTAKLMTEVVTAASATITVATTSIAAAIITVAPNKGKGILVEEPKPLKKQAQIEHDEAYVKELEEELNKNIDWDEVIEKVQTKEKKDNAVMRYQALKRKRQTGSQARKNITIYLRNMAGFKMDYFKGMSYDNIRLIFEKKFNSNVAFLEKTKEQMEGEDSKALKRASESQVEKAAKKQKLDEEVEELKKHLQIVPNDDDDVYTEATPLARKVLIVDYEIYSENNKPYYNIMRADRSYQLFLSFLSLLRNFDREDLEVLWQLVKERFASSKPKNFLDDFLLTTLAYIFEKPNVQAQVWKNQRSVNGLAKVKSWRLLESCRVHIITFTTTQIEKISTNKVHFGSNAQQCPIRS